METVVLFDHKTDQIHTNVVAGFEPDGSLRIDGCDSGKLVKKIWDDYDYEYIITVTPANLPDFVNALGATHENLLEILVKKFAGERAFSAIKTFLETRGISYDFFTWA